LGSLQAKVQRGQRAAKVLAQELAIFSQVKVKHIPPVDQHEGRLQQVIAIGSTASDVQKQIQFAWRRDMMQGLHDIKRSSGVGV
jgi:hypothetical protein